MRIGVRLEDKSEWERRVPLIPKDIKELREDGISVVVQSSNKRAFSDEEYEGEGIIVQGDLDDCDIILGIKEVPKEQLKPNKTYVFFSHVIKGQSYNMPMLKKMMDLGITLIDYERIVDNDNSRLVFFGDSAGMSGMVNSLWSLGMRLKIENVANPFSRIRQARTYFNIEEAKDAVREVANEIRQNGIPDAVHPLLVGFIGNGNVSQGAQKIFDLLPYKEISPKEIERVVADSSVSDNYLYKVVFKVDQCFRPKKANRTFDREEYNIYGAEEYETALGPYFEHFTLLIHCNYWEEKYPRIMPIDICSKMWADGKQPKLKVIGDISCDIGGSIECTVKSTYPGNPVYVYHPASGMVADGFEGHGPVIMAVDILPAEIPRESSTHFSLRLKKYVYDITTADYTVPFWELSLNEEIKRAVILYKGSLTPPYEYLKKYLT